MSNYRIVRSDELYHHGIKGMKWGVRRFQNEDGTLTEAGRKHYARKLGHQSKAPDRYKTAEKVANNYATKEQMDRLRAVDDKLAEIREKNASKIEQFYGKTRKLYNARAKAENLKTNPSDTKVYEECLEAIKKQYPRLHAAVKQEADARNEVYRLEKEIGSQIIGSYANTPIGLTQTYGSLIGGAVHQRVYNTNTNNESESGSKSIGKQVLENYTHPTRNPKNLWMYGWVAR